MDPHPHPKLEPYGPAMSGDWEKMIDHYRSHFIDLFRPVTLSNDTALHIAVCSPDGKPLKSLLAILPSEAMLGTEENLLKRKNDYGNTVLHEATIYRNFEAVKLLVEICPDLVSLTNNFGETPLFTAAEFAEAEIVESLLLSLSQQIVDNDGYLPSIHRQRTSDGLSILSAAIQGQHFETALMLLQLDGSLHSLKDKNKKTALQILAETPSAFKSGYSMHILKRLIYCCLPVACPHEVKLQKDASVQAKPWLGDLESCLGRNGRGGLLNYLNVRIKEHCPAKLRKIWDEKRKHVFASSVAEILIKRDTSWNIVGERQDQKEDKGRENEGPSKMQTSPHQSTAESDIEREIIIEAIKKKNPLFTATKKGIEEMVFGIIERHPHAIVHVNDIGQSIFDVAVKHRKKEIFKLVKDSKAPFTRLRRLIDKEGNTLLHHAARMKEYRGLTKPGPALELQEELQWFEEVREVIPPHYVTLPNKQGEIAEELFDKKHEEQLKKAQEWIKETTQSCSTVAALVATVVFAAAYTVPGGSDEKGTPNFVNSPYFLVFTVSDVVSLASSLTSLVVFLSLMTSPYELRDFRVSIPRKLIFGFTFLFLSVITTMLSFATTILILIQSEKKLTTLLLSIAAFLPVFVFAIMQFNLYVSFMGLTFKKIRKAPPSCLVRRPEGGKGPDELGIGDLSGI